MIGLFVVAVLLIYFVLVAAAAIWLVADEVAERRAEKARIDRDVRKAERSLHDLASNAFGSMLDAARGNSGVDGNWPQ